MVSLSMVAAADQNPPIPKLGETIEVNLVNLDVFVTDKSGARIRNLTRNDFEVFENGVKQTISNFIEYSDGKLVDSQLSDSASSVAVPAFLPAAVRNQRTIIVFIDRFHLSNIHARPFFGALKEALHKAIRPGDAAMIITWANGRLRKRQSFTDDLAALDGAIDQVASESAGAVADDYRQAKDEAADALAFAEEAAANTQTPASVADPAWFARMEGHSRAKMAQFEERQKIVNLKALVRSISADEGKKLMILATHRLSNVAGAEFLYAAGATALEIADMHEFNEETDLESLFKTANSNGVTIYPMYPEGLSPAILDASAGGPGDAGDITEEQRQFLILRNETAALDEIAAHTGGASASGPDSTKLLPQIVDDLQTYYSLAYRSKSGNPDRPRDVMVKAKNPNYVVRARREYIQKSDSTRMEDRVISALFRPPEPPPFRVLIEVGPPRENKRKLTVPITVRIPIASLTTLPDGDDYAGAFSVYVAWGTRLQRVSETSHQTRSFRIPRADILKARRAHYSYTFDLIADGQTERVSLGVLDEVSKDYALNVVKLR